jgi:ABC-type oligopeptide transport system substrate-binding subunit
MRKVIFLIKALLIIFISSTFFVACKSATNNNSENINKEYKVYVYSSPFSGEKQKIVEQIALKLNGTLVKDTFNGFLEYADKKYKVQTVESQYAENFNKNLYYLITTIVDDKDSDKTEHIQIIVSKDCKFISGKTDEIEKKYGNGSYFKSDKNLTSFFELK